MGFIRLSKLFIAITTACHVIHEHSSIATTIHDEQLVYQVKDEKSSSSVFGNSFEKVHPLLRETEFAANKKPKKPPAHKPAPVPTVSPTVALTPADVTDDTDAPDASSSTDDKKKQDPKASVAKSPTNKPSTKKTPPPTDDADASQPTPTAGDSPSDDAKNPVSDDTETPVAKRLSPTKKPSPIARLAPTMKPVGAGKNRPSVKPVVDAEPSSDQGSDSETKSPTKKPIVEKPTRRSPTQKPVVAVPMAVPTEDTEPTSEDPPFQSPTVPEDAKTESPGDDVTEGDNSKVDDSKKNDKNKKKGGSGSGDDEDEKTKAPAPSRTKPPSPTKKPFGKPPKNPIPATTPAPVTAPEDDKADKGDTGDNTPAAGDHPDEDEPEPTSQPAFIEGGGQSNAGSVGGAENVNEEIKNEDRTALNSAKYFSITFVLSCIFCGLLYTFRRTCGSGHVPEAATQKYSVVNTADPTDEEDGGFFSNRNIEMARRP